MRRVSSPPRLVRFLANSASLDTRSSGSRGAIFLSFPLSLSLELARRVTSYVTPPRAPSSHPKIQLHGRLLLFYLSSFLGRRPSSARSFIISPNFCESELEAGGPCLCFMGSSNRAAALIRRRAIMYGKVGAASGRSRWPPPNTSSHGFRQPIETLSVDGRTFLARSSWKDGRVFLVRTFNSHNNY